MPTRYNFEPRYVPGEVVTAKIYADRVYNNHQGKARPVVLLRAGPDRWLVMGLTTLPHFATGEPRVPVPNPSRIGVSQQGYLWGPPTWIDHASILAHIGWADGPSLKRSSAPSPSVSSGRCVSAPLTAGPSANPGLLIIKGRGDR